MKKLLKTTSLCLTLAAHAYGQTMLIDFDNAAGDAASLSPIDGNYWNINNSFGSGELRDSLTADLTGVNLAVTRNNTSEVSNIRWEPFKASNESAPGVFNTYSVFGDGYSVRNGNNGARYLQLAFTGLAANTSYEFLAYGGFDPHDYDSETDTYLTTWDEGSLALFTVAEGTSSSSTYTMANNQTVSFLITSTGTGAITFQFSEQDNPSGPVTFNGLSITQIPEPSSSALIIGLGLTGVMLRRRRL